jgi:hypothetical protein
MARGSDGGTHAGEPAADDAEIRVVGEVFHRNAPVACVLSTDPFLITDPFLRKGTGP